MKSITRISMIMLFLAWLMPLSANAANTAGDVNGDHEVNIADVNALINIILNGSGNNPAADVNGDHEVNIADVNTVINIILGGSAPTPDHEYVDLGLPSGTLWATCNIGANSPEEYGDYFAWGETEPKTVYTMGGHMGTYKWHKADNDGSGLTKYCTQSDYGYNGFTDGKTELDPEDDAAYVNWGPLWRMPTIEQQQELIDNCSCIWKNQNGVIGRLITGPNGNTLFLPSAGYRFESSLISDTSYGFYWSRMLNKDSHSQRKAYKLYFRLHNNECEVNDQLRSDGLTIRAVRVSQN